MNGRFLSCLGLALLPLITALPSAQAAPYPSFSATEVCPTVYYVPDQEDHYRPGCGAHPTEERPINLNEVPTDLLKFLSPQNSPKRSGDSRFLINTEWINGRRVRASSIEVRISKELKLDCNVFQLHGRLEQVTRASSPYSFWRLHANHGAISTMMNCPPNQPLRLVRTYYNNGESTVIPWEGRPIIVDLPKGWELEWRRAGSREPFRFERAF